MKVVNLKIRCNIHHRGNVSLKKRGISGYINANSLRGPRSFTTINKPSTSYHLANIGEHFLTQNFIIDSTPTSGGGVQRLRTHMIEYEGGHL